MEVLSLKELSFRYPEAQKLVFEKVSLELTQGEFALLCGPTGSGKTSLLRQLVPALAPQGKREGSLEIKGHVGFVQQNPDNQIVTDLVFHELAFALENKGVPSQTIRRRVAEIASYFGLEYLLEEKTHTLSGGQKQILNLAATLVTDPELLVLDEPSSELDPIAAQNFLRHLVRVNRELGTTVLCCEHRLDDILTLCDKVFLMGADKNQTFQSYSPQEFVESCRKTQSKFEPYLPEATRIALAVEDKTPDPWPLDVRSGRKWLHSKVEAHLTERDQPTKAAPREKNPSAKTIQPELRTKEKPVLSLKDLSFRHSAQDPLVLRNLQTDFAAGKVHSMVGGNASGKSTLLGLIAGLHKPQRGRVSVAKDLRVSALPQSPQASFITDAVRDELCTPLAGTNWRAHSDSRTATNKDLALRVAQDLGIDHLLDQHPYDLSGGEAQKLALAKVLLAKPDILLLDEPTKGLDACARRELGELFLSLANQGKTLVVVTHDLSFAAQYSDTCSLLANGELMARDLTRNFFRGNSFYTTPTYRTTRKIIKDCVTPLEAIAELSSVKSAK